MFQICANVTNATTYLLANKSLNCIDFKYRTKLLHKCQLLCVGPTVPTFLFGTGDIHVNTFVSELNR